MSVTVAARATPGRIIAMAVLLFLCLFSALPLYVLLANSLQPTSDLLRGYLVPRHLTLSNYTELWFKTGFAGYLLNSLVVAGCTMVLTVVTATMAGYGLTRFRFRGRTLITRAVLFVYMFPSLALAIPLFSMFRQLGLVNTRWGLVIADSSLTLPFGIWIMAQAFQPVPTAYRESAYSLGAGQVRTMVEVELPLVLPALISVAIFAFALSWDDYTLAFILTVDNSVRTLPVGVADFVQHDVVLWGLVQSGAVCMAVPPLLILLFLQRYLLRGLGEGGLKG